jgi:hypothetical protein
MVKFIKKSMRHLKILGTLRVMRSKLCTKDPQILGPTIQNLVT